MPDQPALAELKAANVHKRMETKMPGYGFDWITVGTLILRVVLEVLERCRENRSVRRIERMAKRGSPLSRARLENAAERILGPNYWQAYGTVMVDSILEEAAELEEGGLAEFLKSA